MDVNKCRACLKDNLPMYPLFEIYEENLTLADVLQMCLSIEVHENDNLPPYLCEYCTSILIQFYNFSIIYEQSEKELTAALKSEICDEKIPINECSRDLNDSPTDKYDGNEIEFLDTKSFINALNLSEAVSKEFVLKDDNKNVNEDDIQKTCLEDTIVPQKDFKYKDDDDKVFKDVNKYECSECGNTFLYQVALVTHMAKKHNLQNVNVEDCCVKTKVKVKKSHAVSYQAISAPVFDLTVVPNTTCKLCKKDFSDVTTLKLHQIVHKTFVCEVCGMSFLKKSYLDDHKEGHANERKHVCQYCGKTFKRRTILVKHNRLHTKSRQCICEICGKRFNETGTLKTHKLLLHIKERKWVCIICNQNFPLKATLDKHIRRHQRRATGIKEFMCDQCEMRYSDKSSLNRHILFKHSDVDHRVSCNVCGKQYTTTTNLHKHTKNNH